MIKKFLFNIKRITLITALLPAVIGLCACSDIDGDLMKKSDVLKEVEKSVPSEKYKFVSVEHHDDERPKRDVYYFESKDRNMSFEAVSTLKPIGIDDSTIGYGKHVSSGYVDGVHALYAEEIDTILGRIPKDEKDKYFFTSYTDLEDVLKLLIEADGIYSAEKAYNSEKWMYDNPVRNVALHYRYQDETGEYKTKMMFGVNLSGSEDYDNLHNVYTYQYVEKMLEYELTDETIPDEAYARIRVDKLSDIYIDVSNVSETAYVDAKANNLVNNTRGNSGNDSYAAYYYQPWEKYVVPLNVGLTSEECAPKMLEGYSEALGIDCEISYKKGLVKWEYKGDKWKIVCSQDKDKNIADCEFYKNDDKQSIDYITVDDFRSPIHVTYIVGISAEDFADIFGLQFVINEEEGYIQFYSDEVYRK